ncbi:MAG: patatin-like phospholipase family protein [Clostridiales bacterium]|nr:patatin-like phospholipase family protein [Clostridiales bacterium]
MRFGLALSGGGIRGATHIGVLKALEEEGLKPSWIAGTSAGSIVAGLYSYGLSPQEMEDIAIDLRGKYIDLNLSGLALGLGQWLIGKEPSTDGIVKGKAIEKYLKKLTGSVNIKDIHMPLAIPAVDINRAQTVIFINRLPRTPAKENRTIYINNVCLYKAIRASIAIPVIFKPMILDGRRLVDGGVTDNLPVEILKNMGAERVIGVDLGYNGQLRREVDNLIEIGSQGLDIMAYQITSLKSQGADFIIRPGIYDVAIRDTEMLIGCIDRGYNVAQENMKRIKSAINSSYPTPFFYTVQRL